MPAAPPRRSGHGLQLGEVLAALRGGNQPPVSPAGSRRTLSLVAAIYASAFTRAPVGPADLGPASPFYSTMAGSGARW